MTPRPASASSFSSDDNVQVEVDETPRSSSSSSSNNNSSVGMTKPFRPVDTDEPSEEGAKQSLEQPVQQAWRKNKNTASKRGMKSADPSSSNRSIQRSDVESFQRQLHLNQLSAFQNALDEQDWDALVPLLEDTPELARCQVLIQCHGEKTPVLPLHAVVSASSACSARRHKQQQCQKHAGGCPIDVVERLVMMHPSALQTGDKNRQRWPLHFALSCRGRASLALIKYLVRCAPAALQQVDGQGCLPLHYAAQYASAEVCRFLLEAHPSACQQAITGKGRYVLHLLAARVWEDDDDDDLSLDLLRRALDAHPAAVSLPDCHGRLPLHHAAVQTPHPTWNVLDLLVQAHSPALLVKDQVGPYTPLTAYKWIHSRCSGASSSTSSYSSRVSARLQLQQQHHHQQHHDNDVVAVYLQERTAKERRKHRAGAIEKFFTIKIPGLRQQQQQQQPTQKTTTTSSTTNNKKRARTRTTAAASSLLYCYG